MITRPWLPTRRENNGSKSVYHNQQFLDRFAARVRELYLGAPKGRKIEITEHACQKYSGRVGRSAAAKDLAEGAVDLGVKAHVGGHQETDYDSLLAQSYDRRNARERVAFEVARVLAQWKK